LDKLREKKQQEYVEYVLSMPNLDPSVALDEVREYIDENVELDQEVLRYLVMRAQGVS
jgi:hypothetical protein